MNGTKIILNSVSGYTPSQAPILVTVLEDGLSLFCAVGKDCGQWEEAMDDLCEQRGGKALDVVTTCHPGETPEEVMDFAKEWPAPGPIKCVTV
jgi:hypothetical protein